MFRPDVSEVLLEGESEIRLLELYEATLQGRVFETQVPNVIEETRCWELTKIAWRVKRLGCDSDEIRAALVSGLHHEKARLTSRSQDWRAALIKGHVENMRAVDAAFDQIAPQAQASKRLRVVK